MELVTPEARRVIVANKMWQDNASKTLAAIDIIAKFFTDRLLLCCFSRAAQPKTHTLI